MAELLGRWQTAVDSNLNAYPGAKLLTFDSVAKTTPKTTYSDPELTTPHTNPVIANGSGQFPQIFASSGEVFYLVLNTAANVLVDDFEDVNALGDAGGNQFSRDFGLGGRIEFSGVDGVVDISVGPPAGDDVGGEGRIGGWDGTQGEELEVDFALTKLTGALEVAGAIRGPEPIGLLVPTVVSRGTVTAAASLEIALPATHPSYILEIRNFVGSVATAQNIIGHLSFDDAATYKTAAGDYQNASFYNGGSTTSTPAANAASMAIISGMGGGLALGGTDAKVQIWLGAGRETRALSAIVGFTAGNNLLSVTGHIGSTTNNKGYGRATNLRLTPSTGTMSFSWVLIGQP